MVKISLTNICLICATAGSKLLGPLVRTPVSANLGINFNPGFFFFSSKALSRIIFSILLRISNHQIVGKENQTEFAFSALISVSSNFALTLGYLNPSSNNPAMVKSVRETGPKS